ncbi:ABC transporter ATP-binding protein [Desulfovibrio gilichinskyi]|uniref:Sulfonate transport system ATP-binding protein n=1 Tax=Desulfovibrio gilichinskyi TaxID=1519643 RepID=A0A1X7F2M9_9BACT|nr:ABC transporter ATP-binding protein [Desulfovibrio gilichinskyi]SMF44860.1 sulfonate transport system ATP-binding protein [Desulfovibrio gilichinskyi]
MPIIKIDNLCKSYRLNGGYFHALQGISARIEHGSFVTIVGKSGCGKTTLLKILCGLKTPSEGSFSFLKEDGSPSAAKIGVVFQEARLMPWMTVEKNMAFGMDKKLSKDEAHETLESSLQMLNLQKFRKAYPSQISGGMAQRVALGRTLCANPDVILMDEPFGALDAFTRRNLQKELTEIFLDQAKTIIFVTHDVDEATYLGQRVLVMEEGTITADLPVDLPYPRATLSETFFRIREEILSAILLDDEFKK